MQSTYPKKEHLCSKIIMDKLFGANRPIYEHPLKAFWVEVTLPEAVPVQSLMSVGKRRFKRAVKRNFLKRRMKEAFRLNKHALYQKLNENEKQLAISVVYNSSEVAEYKEIEEAMRRVLDKILEIIGGE